MELNIRPLDDDDLPDCARLFTAVFALPPWNETWLEDQAFERLGNFLSGSQSIGLAAETDGRVCGFLVGEIEQWKDALDFHLKEMCVAPQEQRNGIGRALFQKLSITLNKVGVTHMYLITRRKGMPNDFYAAMGFSSYDNLAVMGKSVGGGGSD